MTALESVKKLALHEKLQVMEAIWEDLSGEPAQLEIPDWHREILDERVSMVLEGTAEFLDWDEVKRQLMQSPT